MKTYAYILCALLTGGAFTVETLASEGSNAPATSAKHARTLTAAGTVTSIDVVGNTLIVEGRKKSSLTFSIPANTKITQNKKTITLGDITTGSKVVVRYTKDGDTLTAASIKVWPAKK